MREYTPTLRDNAKDGKIVDRRSDKTFVQRIELKKFGRPELKTIIEVATNLVLREYDPTLRDFRSHKTFSPKIVSRLLTALKREGVFFGDV